MKKLAEIEPIAILAEIEKRHLSGVVWTLADRILPKKFCSHRYDQKINLVVLQTIAQLLLRNQEVVYLEQICLSCRLGCSRQN